MAQIKTAHSERKPSELRKRYFKILNEACRDELVHLKLDDTGNITSVLLVKTPNSKTKKFISFTVVQNINI